MYVYILHMQVQLLRVLKISHIFLVRLWYLLSWHVVLLKEYYYGELMVQTIQLMIHLMEHYKDILVMEQT